MPDISVVIPVLNGERYIREAIQSVFAQTHRPIEIIVVDDGSSDGTGQIVRQMVGTVPIVYTPQRNQGQSAARNAGVALARGDWVAFLDQDDLWEPQKLDQQVRYMVEHPEASVLCCLKKSFVMGTDGARIEVFPRRRHFLEPLLFEERPTPHTSTLLLQKKVFQEVGGFRSWLRIGEDWDLYARIIPRYEFHCIPHYLVWRRWHDRQTTVNMVLRADYYSLFHAALWDMWKDDPYKRTVLQAQSARVYRDLAKHFFLLGDYTRVRRCSRQAFAYEPWSWKTLRRWGLSYVPGVRDWYRHRKARPEVPASQGTQSQVQCAPSTVAASPDSKNP